MPGFQLQDMVENRQQIFEDFDFCIETLRWALLVIARVGEHVAGKNDWFVWRWTTIQTNNEQLSDLLGIPADGR